MPSMRRSLILILGQNVRALRISKGLSQEEFADLCGLHRTYIGAIERGERNITIKTLEVLAAALGTSLTALLEPSDDKSTS